jgi:ubiquinone/menaquinone biosynthesis C-methylase UbiE
MDLPDLCLKDLELDLKNLETINLHFGGHQATQFILQKACARNLEITSVLDCACGAGDLTRLLSQNLPQATITAVDLHPQTLTYARQKNASSRILWQQADVRKLPFPDQSFDLVICQLALHHFSDADAVTVLMELKRVSRGGVFLTDLLRSTPGYWGVWLLVHTWLNHPMTCHDALLSVRRSFVRQELETLARKAQWQSAQYRSLPWFRQALWLE